MLGKQALLAAFFLIVSTLVNIASASSVCAGQYPRTGLSNQEKRAVVLSPGPKPGVPWGGYHVTITGYSDKHACIQNNSCSALLSHEFKSFFHGKPWRVHGDLSLMKKDNKLGRWIQKFESRTLSDLANKLGHEGFDKIKGPMHSATPWHVTLDHDFTSSKARVAEFKQHKVDWYLWIVTEPGSACKEKGIGCAPDRWRRIH